jgi:hypothetical protein
MCVDTVLEHDPWFRSFRPYFCLRRIVCFPALIKNWSYLELDQYPNKSPFFPISNCWLTKAINFDCNASSTTFWCSSNPSTMLMRAPLKHSNVAISQYKYGSRRKYVCRGLQLRSFSTAVLSRTRYAWEKSHCNETNSWGVETNSFEIHSL